MIPTSGSQRRAKWRRVNSALNDRNHMANKIETLESLLGKDEPNGTFHDSSLLSINVDYDRKMFIADFDMCVGDPEGKDQQARERYRPGRFRVEGFVFWFMEAPTTPSEKWFACPWLTDNGPISSCPTEASKLLLQRAAGHNFAWYFYFSDLNTFAYVAGDSVSFEWT
jgi:hypothetical protein